jgi:hypothetical protein
MQIRSLGGRDGAPRGSNDCAVISLRRTPQSGWHHR